MFAQDTMRDIYGDEAAVENAVENPGQSSEHVTVQVTFYGTEMTSMVFSADQAEEFARKILAAAEFARRENG